LEDVDPFVEEQVRAFAAEVIKEIRAKEFLGRGTGHLPVAGETTPNIVMSFLGERFGVPLPWQEFRQGLDKALKGKIIPREFGFCAGCPHRGTFYSIKKALKWDDRDGFVSGDIGCYSMGIWATGFYLLKSVHAMGSGVGLASGYGKLTELGFEQPVVTVCGDSTFFHAALPAIVNAKFNNSDILLVVLDNSATAMTGFQPHPGTGVTAMGRPTDPVQIEEVGRALGMEVEVIDPYDLDGSAEKIYTSLQKSGPRLIISRRKCALVQGREGGFPFIMEVDENRCVGESCGCGRFCTRVFRCPGLVFDKEKGRAKIDEVVCVGCGVCSLVCPQGAIVRRQK
jgi:indolepyruvate ferredoxin oxidoreductase alpha subunit